MIFTKITVGNYMSNCYIIGCEETKDAAIVDPGADYEKIKTEIEELGLTPKFVILTHAHGDHIGALEEIIENYKLPVYLHEKDADMLRNASENLSMAIHRKQISVNPDRLLKEGDIIKLGNMDIEIIHTPGHTPGSISIKVDNILLTGDTLFSGSIGRTDFPGGSYDEIIDSIKSKLFKYNDETVVYPGHNSPTTIGTEKRINPFVN